MKILQRLIIVALIVCVAFFGYKAFMKQQKPLEPNETAQIVLVTENDIIQTYYPDETIQWIAESGWVPSELLYEYGVYADYDAEDDIVTISDGYETLRYDMAYNTSEKDDQAYDMIRPEVKGDILWIPVKSIKTLYNLEYDLNEQVNTMFLKRNDLGYDLAETTEKVDLMYEADKNRILDVIDNGQTLIVYDYDDKLAKVMTTDYQVGYVSHDRIGEKRRYEGEPVERPSVNRDEKVFLTWEIYGRGYDTDKIGEMRGVNVISPAWYALSDSNGNFESKASENYTNWAKERGYEVWALVSNDFKLDRTNAFLHSASARRHFIQTLLEEYKKMDYDGVNIDFENVYKEDKRQLTQFVAELAEAFRKENMVVSMDVTVMGGSDTWSKCYDRKALGAVVDYLAIMTYDEYWASSPVSGSVASYNWVKRSMEDIQEIVPSEKLLLGIPYYMRVWTEVPSLERPNAMDVKSGVLNMPNAEKYIEEKELNLIWDENARQYYAGYIENGALKKIWFENADSIREKASLIEELGLGGAAVWRRGFETQDIWGIIDDAMKK